MMEEANPIINALIKPWPRLYVDNRPTQNERQYPQSKGFSRYGTFTN